MCGILGQFKSSGKCDIFAFEEALKCLHHRGPDHGAVKDLEHGMLGHRRLSIIDLTAEANQPFSLADDKDRTIIFNGEIYNFQELQAKFTGLRTKSDTEVILKGYADLGVNFFNSLRGIYAFAITDYRNRKNPKLILYRDPAGIKPLYYFMDRDQFVFASEIKAILPLMGKKLSIHEDVIKAYLSIGYCPEPYTAYKEIKALEPGSVIEIDLSSFQISTRALRKYTFSNQVRLTDLDLLERTNDLLTQAVNRNVVSDVPILFSLSGGIDSSLLVALSKRNNFNPETLTVSFDDKDYNESNVAKLYAETLGIKSSFITCDSSGSLELLRKLLLHFDQPYADSSFVPFYFLSKEASTRGKVLVGGDGGDEIHAGYTNFVMIPRLRRLKALHSLIRLGAHLAWGNKKRLLTKIAFLTDSKSDEELMYLRESWLYPELSLNGEKPFNFDYREGLDLYASCFASDDGDSFNSKFSNDVFYRRMLSDYLRKTDMMSMINSIEYRVPMLDEDLVEFSLGIPLDKKIEAGRGKKILKDIHRKFYPAVTTDRVKSGFSIPLDTWLSKEDFREMENYILADGIVKEFIRPAYIHHLFKAFNDLNYLSSISRAGVYQQILILYSLQLWFREGRD